MYKKMKGVSFDPFPKHQALIQDYQNLQKESEIIRNRFENTKHKKSVLLAEVRFLRRRYKQLLVLRRNYQNLQSEQQKRIPNEKRRMRRVVLREAFNKKEERFGLKPIPDLNQEDEGEEDQEGSRAPPVFDLNQIAKEEPDVDDFRRPMKMMMNGRADEQQKLPSCSRINGGKGKKRKISWQDPVVALKVLV